ncbi:MAG: ABC transporter permease [Bifidobacteriaceae bacterium]|nr:ABC transporter permease [Bifidobacteriaceae bacterium]
MAPAVTLGLTLAPRIAQVFRASLLETATQEHVRAAWLKEISLRHLRWRHISANSLGPVSSVIGLELGGLLGGAVITESLFNWPGVGTVTVQAIEYKDYPVVVAAVVAIAALFIAINTAVDLVNRRLDPRTAVSL